MHEPLTAWQAFWAHWDWTGVAAAITATGVFVMNILTYYRQGKMAKVQDATKITADSHTEDLKEIKAIVKNTDTNS